MPRGNSLTFPYIFYNIYQSVIFNGCFFSSRYLLMGTAKSAVDLMGSSSEVHFSGFHMDGFEKREASAEQPTTSATDVYNQPFVIGVFSYGKLPK